MIKTLPDLKILLCFIFACLTLSTAAVGCSDDDTTAGEADGGGDTQSVSDVAPTEDTAVEVPTCDAYCATVQLNWTGSNAQYGSLDECTSYCQSQAQLPAGEVGDASGNTIGCRMKRAEAAQGVGSSAENCPLAGPSGGDSCGSWCENYCHLESVNCTGTHDLVDDAMCLSECASYPSTGSPGDASGNTVQCRIYHLGIAGSPDNGGDVIHCPHGSFDGAGTCVD